MLVPGPREAGQSQTARTGQGTDLELIESRLLQGVILILFWVGNGKALSFLENGQRLASYSVKESFSV